MDNVSKMYKSFVYTASTCILVAIGIGFWFLCDLVKVPVPVYKGTFCGVLTIVAICILGKIIDMLWWKKVTHEDIENGILECHRKYGSNNNTEDIKKRVERKLPSYIQVKVYGKK